MAGIGDDVIKLLLAVILGGLIGMEREFRDKSAGFRTVILICLGATLFTTMSIDFAPEADPARIAAQIVTGVGFLGAGAILRDGGRILGLTTAAIIWLAASIGMVIGAGQYFLAVAATALVVVVLWLFPKIELWIDNLREEHHYEITCRHAPDTRAAVERLLHSSGLSVTPGRFRRQGETLVMTWKVQGSPDAQQKLTDALLASPDVQEVRF